MGNRWVECAYGTQASLTLRGDLNVLTQQSELRRLPRQLAHLVAFSLRRSVEPLLSNLRLRMTTHSGAEIKLHIGCGGNLLPGWINADITTRAPYWIDARRPLPFPDDTVAYIFAEHLIEHLTKSEAAAFLAECFRVLKHRGVLRLSTPDLFAYAGAYVEDSPRIHEVTEREMRLFPHSCIEKFGSPSITPTDLFMRVVNCQRDHRYIFDERTLTQMLHDAGFSRVERCEYGHSQHRAMTGLEMHEAPQYEDLMAHFTLILEATK